MAALPIAVAVAAILGSLGWRLDQQTLGCESKLRAGLASLTLAVGSGLCGFVQALLILKVPRSYGPVQFWVGSDAPSLIELRFGAFLVLLGGCVSCVILTLVTLVSLLRTEKGTRSRTLVLPCVATVSVGLAYSWYFGFRIFPTA